MQMGVSCSQAELDNLSQDACWIECRPSFILASLSSGPFICAYFSSFLPLHFHRSLSALMHAPYSPPPPKSSWICVKHSRAQTEETNVRKLDGWHNFQGNVFGITEGAGGRVNCEKSCFNEDLCDFSLPEHWGEKKHTWLASVCLKFGCLYVAVQ